MTLDPTREQVTLDRINQLEGPNRDYRAVAEVLEAEGWPSPTGEPWTYQAVTSILVMYTGCTASSADPPAVMGYLSQPSGIPSGTGCKPNLEETDVNQIEDAEQHRMLLLKALYKTSDPNRPIQDLNNIFHDFGLDVSDGMAAAQFLVKAGMLRWHSDQQPGAVRLLYPGVVAAEKLLKEEQQAGRPPGVHATSLWAGWGQHERFVQVGGGRKRHRTQRQRSCPPGRSVSGGEGPDQERVTRRLPPHPTRRRRGGAGDRRPQEPTEHLPAAGAIQNFFLGQVTGLQQQHSSPGASQHQHIEVLNADELNLVKTFVQEYRQQLATSSPNEEALAQVNEHLANIEEELESEQPDRGVIEKAMQTLKLLGVGIGVNLTTQGVVAALNHFL